jgi:hypothetical protein
MTASTGQRHRWSAPEIEQALTLAGDVPWPLLPLLYNRWANAHGHPRRTEPALRQRVEANGGGLTPTGTWLTAGSVSTILGLHPNTARDWACRWPDILQPYQPPGRPGSGRRGFVYLKRDRIRAFARQHPEQFGGIAADRLMLLLEQERLVAAILDRYPRRPLRPAEQTKPVRCVETGEVFPSRMAAARACHITSSSIGAVAKGRGHTAAGYRWEEVAA